MTTLHHKGLQVVYDKVVWEILKVKGLLWMHKCTLTILQIVLLIDLVSLGIDIV